MKRGKCSYHVVKPCVLLYYPLGGKLSLYLCEPNSSQWARKEGFLKPRHRQHLVPGGVVMGVAAVVLALALPSHNALNHRLVNRVKLVIRGSRQ